MPRKNVKPFKDIHEFLEQAKKNLSDIAEDGIRATNWDELEFSPDIRIADFVEQRFAGMNENFIRMEHDINTGYRRLENMEDSPRKKAAQIMLDQYKSVYEEVCEYTYLLKVYNEAQSMTYQEPHKSRLTDAIKRERSRLDRENMMKLREKTEELTTCQNMFGSFFKDNAIAEIDIAAERDLEREEAQARVLARMTEQLIKEGPEYDIYRTMQGYTAKRAEKLVPQAASLIMNSNVLTDVSANDFPKRIRAERPRRLDLDWGVSTFDNMMDSLYNQDELKSIARDGKSFLDTVYLDGKPAKNVFPMKKESESEVDYERRMKCEIVAYALEGKGKIDIAPYVKTENGYGFKDPIPVHVKVNLKEELSGWKRFKRFLGLGETQKEKVERISLDRLGEEERHAEIKEQICELAKRENDRHRMKMVINQATDTRARLNRDFLGFMVAGKTPEEGKTVNDLITSVLTDVPKIQMSLEMAETLQIGNDYQNGSADILKTFYRESTRANLCALYAMTQGMSMEQIFSDAPELKESKQKIGESFIKKITPLGEDEFYKKNGKDADYKAYFQEYQKSLCDTFGAMHRKLSEQPFDFYQDYAPEQLAADYPKADFLISVSQDLFQCCPEHVKLQMYDELEALGQNARCIGELKYVSDYCEKYLSTDAYVQPQHYSTTMAGTIVDGLTNRVAMERLQKDCHDIKTLGELQTVTNAEWSFSIQTLRAEAAMTITDEDAVWSYQNYLYTGKNPVTLFDTKTRSYHLDKPEEILKRKVEKNENLLSFEEISKEDIKVAKKNYKVAMKEAKKQQKELKKTLK